SSGQRVFFFGTNIVPNIQDTVRCVFWLAVTQSTSLFQMIEGRIHTSFCKEFSKDSNELLALSKVFEVKSNDSLGHGEEMFQHQLAIPFIGASSFARRNIATTTIDDPLLRQKVCKLAMALAIRVSTAVILPSSEVSIISFEIAKACIVDGHKCAEHLRPIIAEAISRCGLTTSELRFISTRMDQVAWS
ncbi:Hypothetical protein, putative, partial [Bodo saltans]